MAEATFRLMTPRTGAGGASSGAIAIVQLDAPTKQGMDRAIASIGLKAMSVGEVSLRDLLGVDEGLVCRWSPTSVQLMPHGGAVVVRSLEGALAARGITASDDADGVYPEARDEIEVCTLRTIARAQSPRAVDMILEHAARARDGVPIDPSLHVLGALIEPPIVACVGRANVGKSSLLNALALRDVAIVSDHAGTTRDHVGVPLELDGLTVRWVDTPGVREGADEIELEARALARGVIASAALVVSCSDESGGFLDDGASNTLRVGTKADLSGIPGSNVRTSAATGEGLVELARAIRRRIVPDSALDSHGTWAFSDGLRDAIGPC